MQLSLPQTPLPIFAPDPRLAPFLMHFMALDLDGRESRLPAGLSPNLLLFVRGGVRVKEEDGSLQPCPRFMLTGPNMSTRHSFSEPGTLALSVMFRPGLLEESLGIAAPDTYARILDIRDIVGNTPVEQLFGDLAKRDSVPEQVQLLQDFLLSTLNLVPKKKSIGQAFLSTHQKMFTPLIDLALAFGIGERQLERRVRQVFGVSLRDVRRMTRFGLTLQRLLGQSVAHGDLTHVAHEAGYYDQAHMHRDFVEMSGLGPIQLIQKIASDDPAYWVYRIPPDDFKKLFIPID